MCVCVVVVVIELLLCFVLKVGTFTSPVLVLDVGPCFTLEHVIVCVCVCVHVCTHRCIYVHVCV